MRIRLARPEDCETLLRIYAPYVTHTTASFEYEVPSVEEFRNRIRDIGSFYPYLAAEEDGEVVGYAYAHRLGERAAYDWSAELAVYLEEGHTAKGVGTGLYRALLELLERQGVRNVFALVTSTNGRSAAFHEKCGFERVGTLRHAGFKSGQWLDLFWYEKCIHPGKEAGRVIPLAEVPRETIRRILDVGYKREEEIRREGML